MNRDQRDEIGMIHFLEGLDKGGVVAGVVADLSRVAAEPGGRVLEAGIGVALHVAPAGAAVHAGLAFVWVCGAVAGSAVDADGRASRT